MQRAMLTALTILLGWPLGGEHVAADPAARAPVAARVPVLVELFTSEGCSSCPRADALLSWLLATQPVPGVEVLALGEHVDYWDRLGWRDRFSSPQYTKRQSDYGRDVFRSGTVYTPQAVVDGASDAVGSDAAALRRELARAAQRPKIALDVASEALGADRLRVTVRVGAAGSGPTGESAPRADLWLAVVEDGLQSAVAAGENEGRTLSHSAVVRSLEAAARLEPRELAGSADAGSAITRTIALPPEWSRANLRVVAFLQDPQSRRVLGAGSVAAAPARPR